MTPDEKIVFAVSPTEQGTDILLGIPTAAWEYMKDGKTHTFDLTKLGLPIRLIVYGGPDQLTVLGYIEAHNKALGNTIADMRDRDFGIGDKPKR